MKPGDLRGFRKLETESWNREERKSSIVYLAFNNKNKSQFRTEWSAIQSAIKNFVNHSYVRRYSNSHELGKWGTGPVHTRNLMTIPYN